jgi:hypothetical protein
VLNQLSTTPRGRMKQWMYRSTFSFPQQYLEVNGQLHAPAALPPRKEPLVSIEYEVECTPVPVWTTWRREKSLPYRDSNSDPSVVQPVPSRYTDYAIPAPNFILLVYFTCFERIKVGLCDHHAVCVPVCLCTPHQLLNGWTNLYQTSYV